MTRCDVTVTLSAEIRGHLGDRLLKAMRFDEVGGTVEDMLFGTLLNGQDLLLDGREEAAKLAVDDVGRKALPCHDLAITLANVGPVRVALSTRAAMHPEGGDVPSLANIAPLREGDEPSAVILIRSHATPRWRSSGEAARASLI